MPKHCEHYYWDTNIKYKYRFCKFCFYREYNYGGGWKPEIKFEHFIAKWTTLDGHQFIPRIRIEGCQLFEFQCYESWGVAIKVFIDDKEFGAFHNLNQADRALSEYYDNTGFSGSFTGKVRDESTDS